MSDPREQHRQIIELVRSRVEVIDGQRVSHVNLMAATTCLAEAAEQERLAGNLERASEINHLVLATFRAALRVDDILPSGAR